MIRFPPVLPQLQEERDAWERWYLVLRAHLTAYRRPTATWSPAAAAAAAAAACSANASSESPASAASGGEPESSEEENAAAAATVAAAVGRGQGRGGRGGGSSNRSSAGGGSSSSGDVDGVFDGGIDGALLTAKGEEEEEEERVKGLQEVVMKRAGLEGEFDMNKVRSRRLALVKGSVGELVGFIRDVLGPVGCARQTVHGVDEQAFAVL